MKQVFILDFKRRRIYMKLIIKLFIIISFLSLVKCSYVISSIEGKITNRATFSIDVEYDDDNQQLTINWPEAQAEVDSAAFAGYEIYISEDMNNEYCDYQLVAARFDQGSNFEDDTNMNLVDTATYTIDFSYGVTGTLPQVSGATFQVPSEGGMIFIRVGIIYWDEESEDGRIENWNPDISGYYFYNDVDQLSVDDAVQDWFYQHKSKLSLISGYQKVDIPAQ